MFTRGGGIRLLSLSQASNFKTPSITTLLAQRSLSQVNASPIITGTLPAGGKGVALSQYAEVQRIFTEDQVAQFGALIGDSNPLHSPQTSFPPGFEPLEQADIIQWQQKDSFATQQTSRVLVHGIMVASLFSSIFGTLIPGSVYRSQSLNFCAPVFCNELVTGRVQVTNARRWRRAGLVLQCDTKVICLERECITGQASVWLPGGELLQSK